MILNSMGGRRMNGTVALNLRGLRGFGSYGGGAPEVFPGGPPLIGGDDQGIWGGTNTQFWSGAKQSGYYYTPLPAAVLAQVSDKWISLQQSPSPADQTFFAKYQQKLGVLTNSLYIAVGNHNMFGYSADAIKQVADAANGLKNACNEILQYQMQPVVVQQPAPLPMQVQAQVAPTANYYVPPTGPTSQPGGAQVQVQQSGATGTGPMVVADTGSSWLLPAAIGGGVLVLAGVIFATRRKSSSMGRYRRRR